jgi:hypothetical protein
LLQKIRKSLNKKGESQKLDRMEWVERKVRQPQ